MTQAEHSSNLYARLRGVWGLEMLLGATEGALAFTRWGVSLFLAGVVIDWLLKLPAPGRAVILVAVLGTAVRKAWRAGWRRLRPFNAARTALQIETHEGDMHSLLVSAVQLRQAAARGGTSQALCDMTCARAEQAVRSVKAENTVSLRPARRPAAMVAGVILVLVIVSLTHGPLLLAGAARMFAPWLAVDYPTRTRLLLAEGDRVVQEGKPVVIAADIAGIVPKKARIALRTGKGRPRVRTLTVDDKRCEYRIETAFRGFEYRLMAGDARTPWHTVEVIASPTIERAEVRLDYPAYTGRSPETLEALTLTVPETSRIHWTLSLDRPVSEARVNLAGQDAVAMTISPDGRTVQFEQVAAESRAYSFAWVERNHRFAFTSPSYYLQVAPDRPPRVELTFPKRNLYATLGRKLDLAFRARDDHGIAESAVIYRLDKTEEQKVAFTPDGAVDGSEQTVDWDYRSVLPDLAVGQTVSFAVEVADRYPGPNGPHRVRTEFRRLQFMSREDYLAQVEREKKRLLSQLRNTYREERKVHEVIMQLDPADPVFIQNCQLEAVRQDLMGEQVRQLAGRMQELIADLAANGITDEPVIESLDQLRADLLRIAAGHVSPAADALRTLASESHAAGRDGAAGRDHAVYMVNSTARELGLLVLQLGFTDAAEVMAREMHAAAQTQAALRLRTIMPDGGDSSDLAAAQARLGRWLTRLFEASPKETESTVEDALIEFTLTRIVKQMINRGTDTKLATAAERIGDGRSADAAALQAEVIAALLEGEFRLLVGAEREALAEAKSRFEAQQQGQRELRLGIEGLNQKASSEKADELAEAQQALHENLQLLLMPAVPARRTKLFDDSLPTAPPVNDLLGAADAAMTRAAAQLKDRNRDAAVKAQSNAESVFAELADISGRRIAAMTQAVRIGRLSYATQEVDETLGRFAERQLSLLEKTEDAAADGTDPGYLANQQEALVDAVDELRIEVADRIATAPIPSEHSLSLPTRMASAMQTMREALPLLQTNKPGEAARHQEAAIAALEGARKLLAEHVSNIGPYAAMLAMTRLAVTPSPYVREIEEEQRDMLELTGKVKPEEMPKLAIPQKNLVHAVDAILAALDPIAHLVESGTVMLFAKEDMDAAGTALEIRDKVEALDAQEYIVETLVELRTKIDAVVPQYRYLLEITEALHENVQEGILIREAQRTLREKAVAGGIEPDGLSKEQASLTARAELHGRLMSEITGLEVMTGAVDRMAEAGKLLAQPDAAATVGKMLEAEQGLQAGTATVLVLMKHLNLVLAAPPPATEIPQELTLLREVLDLAAQQKQLYRRSFTAKTELLPEYEPGLRAFEKACAPFIERAKQHRRPGPSAKRVAIPGPPEDLHVNLVTARKHLVDAADGARASDREKVVASQKRAAESLRHFIVDYALTFVSPPPPPPPQDPAPTDDFNESEDIMALFMPGAVSGKRPPDGRLEWEVLGKRDRAALNENFARELPLEYRAILKDYYERLAK